MLPTLTAARFGYLRLRGRPVGVQARRDLLATLNGGGGLAAIRAWAAANWP